MTVNGLKNNICYSLFEIATSYIYLEKKKVLTQFKERD